MGYVKVLDVSELPNNQMAMVNVAGKEVLLTNAGGTYYAIANKCNHLGGSLAKGDLSGETVTCPKHGAQFDVKTGQALEKAKIAMIRMQVKDQESYQVKVDGTSIMVLIPH
jgi:3-phenylpropionate/trans-cinnamate dioxygenase ferredoxin subunit